MFQKHIIQNRLLISGFLLMLMLIAIMGYMAVKEAKTLGNITDDIYNHPFAVSNAAREIHIHINSIHRYMKDVVLADNDEELELAISKVDIDEIEVYKNFDVIIERFLGDKSKIIEARKTFSDWRLIRSEVIKLMRKGNKNQAAAITKGKGVKHINLLLSQIHELVEFANNKAIEFHSTGTSIIKRALVTLYGLCAFILIIGLMISINVIIKINASTKKLEESEERFDLAVKGSSDGLWDWDIDNDNTWWSPRFYELLGYEDGEKEAAQQNFLDMLHPEDKDKTLAAIQSHLEQRTPYDLECLLQTKSGGYRWFRTRGQAVWNKQGKAVRMAGSTQDISERKQYEKALASHQEELEEKISERTGELENAQRLAHVGSWSRDIKTNTIYWSDEAYRIYGLSKDEVPVMTRERIMQSVHPDDHEKVFLDIEQTFETGADHAYEYRIVRPDGSQRILHAYIEVYFDKHGNAVGLGGTFQDITERKQAEEDLRISEERLNLAIQGSNDGLWDWDIVNDKLWWSPRYYELLDYENGEIEASFECHQTLLHPEDKDRVLDSMQLHYDKQIPYDLEYRLQTKSGDYRWFHSRGHAILRGDGKPVRMAGSIQDIAERKQAEQALKESEEQLRCYYDAGLVGMSINKADKSWLQMNDTYCNIIGHTREELQNINWQDITHPDDMEVSAKYHRQLWAGEIDRCTFDKRYFRKDGEIVYVSLSTECIRKADGTVDYIISFVHDITERKQAEAELEKHREHLEELVKERTIDLTAARDEAEYANAAKSDFLSHMSHELRTPMNAILGFGQLLEMDAEGFTKTQRENVQEILAAGHHLLDLINDVLDLAKIESGKLDISMEEVQVDDLLQQCLTLISRPAQARHVELIDQISNKGYTIQADFTRLKQVLLNLLTNAVKYNRENGSITINSEIIDKQRLRIRVTDTGEGLTETDIAKLFISFERLDKVDNIEGTGIGLVISKHLIELMGGSIGIESIPGEGSTFWVELALFNDALEGITEINLFS